ncbi:hypothetical protein TRVL_06257 [Trypanosoma vivax]|nr:hypothetical protein TRVL_06257 [Trypanosoma vivax]
MGRKALAEKETANEANWIISATFETVISETNSKTLCVAAALSWLCATNSDVHTNALCLTQSSDTNDNKQQTNASCASLTWAAAGSLTKRETLGKNYDLATAKTIPIPQVVTTSVDRSGV